jgi:CRP/FNR family cyclic AMP-dependent transcriptional regulator
MPSNSDFLNLFGDETTTVTLAPGEALFSEGEPGGCMYLVRSGTVRVSTGATVLDQFGAGSILGEMALIDDTPRSATVVAVTDCEISVIDRERFLALIRQTPSFALGVMKVLSHRLREMNRRYRY